MPAFKRACRLCGKQVSSISGLTRHTEYCREKLKKKALDEVENVNCMLLPPPTHSGLESHCYGYISQEQDCDNNSRWGDVECNNIISAWDSDNTQLPTEMATGNLLSWQ